MSRNNPEATPAKERAANVESLRAVPLSAFCADSEDLAERVRADLVARAEAGQDVYAYQPACGDPTAWTIWLGSGDPAHDDRMTPCEATAHYVAARAAAWLAGDAGAEGGKA